ncbi:MAG: hypothetical protein ACTMH8_06130 [Brevibacterium aurantiacum]
MPPHGTRARYHRGCKCHSCRTANSSYDRALRSGHRTHGNAAAYRGGCHCEECTSAYALWAEQQETRREAARVSPAEVSYRLGELEHLLAGGIWPPTAARRVGWSVETAERAAARHGKYELAARIANARRRLPISANSTP